MDDTAKKEISDLVVFGAHISPRTWYRWIQNTRYAQNDLTSLILTNILVTVPVRDRSRFGNRVVPSGLVFPRSSECGRESLKVSIQIPFLSEILQEYWRLSTPPTSFYNNGSQCLPRPPPFSVNTDITILGE